MKKKFVSIALMVMMVATMLTACGGDSETTTAPETTPEVTTVPEEEPEEVEPEVVDDSETEVVDDSETEVVDDSEEEGFTLLDVSTDMIDAGVYAVSEDGTELVFSMFTEPAGTPMASLFVFTADGSGDVICGPYAAESVTDEDGIAWTLMTVADVYTGGEYEIGFGESEAGEVYLFGNDAAYEGAYLTEDETIEFMGAAAALLEQ